MAESVRLQQTRQDRGYHGQVQRRDRRWAALTHGSASGDRGGGCRPHPQPHAGAGTPGVRPHRVTPARAGLSASTPSIRATKWLIGSILQLLDFDLPVPDHSTLSRRAETLEVPRPKAGSAPVHLLVDSTGLKFCGPGEWLIEKHGTKRRRAWRVLHLATDADTGRIVASVLTDKDADDGSQVGTLLDQVDGPVASFTGDGAYDRDDVYAEVATRHPAAAVVVPPRANAVPSETAGTA